MTGFPLGNVNNAERHDRREESTRATRPSANLLEGGIGF